MTITEPGRTGLALTHEHDRSLRVNWCDRELFRYVYRPWDDQLESPRPYFHPLWTLDGRPVSLYRPHDHVWHKGLSLALANVGTDNFWGGPTYLRAYGGYAQLPNNGTQRHDRFTRLSAAGVTEELTWLAADGRVVFAEERTLDVSVLPSDGAWQLDVMTSLRNVGVSDVAIGSPSTEGRPGAAYSGLFWRGPRSFSGGTVRIPDAEGTDELNGARAPWMAFTGRHDGDGERATLLMADLTGPTPWFVRSEVYAVLCPAAFAAVRTVAPDETLVLHYRVVVADGDLDHKTCARLAA
ncbi:Methane oxygenase PmoA [Asanoa hainanensis]|uniref:Methane oxygenase PmoA n=1 Tax=Asanoa hainanensis TaxID=560556 RepID=A0A239PG63_9ACTN|nr:PmoA family protein [Asanoa hainanensis]SNT65608.1 Methane oxygenase PmoA [Asanoa hainanensis]